MSDMFNFGFQPMQGPGSTPFQSPGFGKPSIMGGNNFGPGQNLMQQGTFWDQLKGRLGTSFDKIGSVVGSEGFQNSLGAFNTLAGMYTGFKSLGLARDQLDFQKNVFNKNYNAQVKDYENTLKDRWTARNASASIRGRTFAGMDQWLSGRRIGSGPSGSGRTAADAGYRANSPQDFYSANNADNRPIPRRGG